MTNADTYRYEIRRDNQENIMILHDRNALAPASIQHFHESTEFIYVADGSIRARIGNTPLDVHKGQILSISAFLPHDCPRDYAELWQLIVPRAHIGSLDKLMENKTFDRLVITDEDGQLLSYMKIIYEMRTRSGLFASFDETSAENAANAASANFTRIMISLCGLKEEEENSSLAMRAIRYLSAHFREEIRIGDMSTHLYCNRSQLSALFFKMFGMSMNQYLTRLRAMEVRRLLSERSDITLSEACIEAGFGSLRTLHRAYKEIYGCAPRSTGER